MPVQQILLIYPQIVLSIGILVILLFGLARKNPESMQKQITVLSIILLVLTTIISISVKSTGVIENLFCFDMFTRFFLLFAVCSAGLTIILASQSNEIAARRFPEFAALLLTIVIGISLMAAAEDLIVAYLSMEMVSLSSYILTGFKKTHRSSHEAALKYVIFGGVASGIMIFGMSLLYGLAGTTSYSGIALILSDSSAILNAGSDSVTLLTIVVPLFMVFTGIFFKIAAVPFHMWCPDVYQGAPTPFTGFLSVAPKAAGFAFLLRFVSILLPLAHTELKTSLLAILGLISAVTMTLGNFSAINQMNVKRLLAYSSIAHAGYLLMGVTVLDQSGYNAILLYLSIYLFMNMGAFAVVQIIADTTGSEDISAFRGLGYRMPVAALAMGVFLFSLAGIPPLAGFIGKFYLFAALIKAGGFWYIVLALVGILNSVVALFYYARILREMYLSGMDLESPLKLDWIQTGLLTVVALAMIVFGLYWEPLRNLVSSAVLTLKLL
jgi:NADH-quinone oxidoreductase subunit N